MAARFVICEAQSNTQVEAIARSVEEFTEKQHDESPWTKQGLRSGQWALLDYADVVVHIFHKDWRGHYGLEELWADAEQTHIPDASRKAPTRRITPSTEPQRRSKDGVKFKLTQPHCCHRPTAVFHWSVATSP